MKRKLGIAACALFIASLSVWSLLTVTAENSYRNSSGVTGTGNLVYDTSPTRVTPLLGTPTSGNLANCTGYPVSAATFLQTTTNDPNSNDNTTFKSSALSFAVAANKNYSAQFVIYFTTDATADFQYHANELRSQK